MTRPHPGALLIAAPGLLDPNFRRTVVLLCDHGPESSMGLVVNRPMQVPISKFFPQMEDEQPPKDQGLIHCGGPVETNRMLVLRHGAAESEMFHEILSDVALVADIEAALEVEESEALQNHYRFFLGYAGWGEHQLDRELDEEAWIVRPASSTLIFDTPPSEIWAQALRELGGLYALYAEMPLDPSLN